MALVAASAALDIPSWAEFGTVEYPASTLASLSNIIDHVGYKLNRTITATSSPSDAQIADWLVRAKQEIAEMKNYTWKRRYVTGTLTAGTFRYAMPPDYAGGPVKVRDMTNDADITVVSNHQFDVLYPDVSASTNGNILIVTIKNRELWTGPAPDNGDVIELEYTRSGEDIADGTAVDFTWLPQIERWRCVDACLVESFEALHDYEKAQYYRQKLILGMRSSRRADSKKKWAGVPSGRSIFQA